LSEKRNAERAYKNEEKISYYERKIQRGQKRRKACFVKKFPDRQNKRLRKRKYHVYDAASNVGKPGKYSSHRKHEHSGGAKQTYDA
jgi:hypothetical protein